MGDQELKEIVENSLSQPCLCPGCEKVYLREDMAPYLGTFFAKQYTLLCRKCHEAAEKMYLEKTH